jgi:ATP-dependent Clp protease ATP-binding subunit ClpC
MDDFTAGAASAIAAAELEARGLGHDRVGTEHLLLGLFANEPGGVSAALREAGATLAAARHKVADAVGPASPELSLASGDPLPMTARAERALARAVRFAHASGEEAATADHLLRGVLDVEGTAGQVLRGLGVDVRRLYATVAGESA